MTVIKFPDELERSARAIAAIARANHPELYEDRPWDPGNILKMPYTATRAVHSRKPRRSKNGTPEERAAKAAREIADECEIAMRQLGSPVR